MKFSIQDFGESLLYAVMGGSFCGLLYWLMDRVTSF